MSAVQASSEYEPEVAAIVTGAGGAAGVAVIRCLVARGVRVIAADADDMAAGLRLASSSSTLPLCTDPTFVDRVCRLAVQTGAGVLVSTVAEEMQALSRGHRDLAAAGLRTWLPAPGVVETCIDKWSFAVAMRRAGISAPATALGGADDVPGPWIVKPRFGRGSRDVYAVDLRDELEWALRRVPEPIVQTRLCGREFTVDCLVGRDGTLAGAVPRWRLETKAGISTRGATFVSEAVLDGVRSLLSAIGLRGPANVQGFLAADGAVSFVEVNPRFSGGLPLSLAAGADLVGQYLRGLLGLPIQPEGLRYREGVRMVRYFEEVFEG
ncbi:MAG TPA: ATP-grasp domain-containing protein [Solirubrobacteraceae bacterium]|jgi:carbamoyl-phosphate synthase large subunit|nr:ATP-grasp domain-containing protein [Solirubrobacteraceae bacterium]